MGFIILLILVTLSIAGSAAFFSIYGLAQIFTGAFWAVVVMASSLEAGKLIAASFAYRYWNVISFSLKTYMLAAVFVLMVITSAGIFGFLSAAYQQNVLDMRVNEQQIELLLEENERLEQLRMERLARKDQIDTDIASLPNEFVTGRQRLMESYRPELEQLTTDIAQYGATIRENSATLARLRASTLEQEAHVGPIIFIARVFEQTTDDTTKWLILIIIFAFDPLAVALTVGANIALMERAKTKREEKEYSLVDDLSSNEMGEEEPTPQITSIEQLLEQPKEDITIEQIRGVLKEFQHKNLTPEETAQQMMLEELLRRKEVTERVRNPKGFNTES
jgi:hypothetical protein